jgi:hypothetical protein
VCILDQNGLAPNYRDDLLGGIKSRQSSIEGHFKQAFEKVTKDAGYAQCCGKRFRIFANYRPESQSSTCLKLTTTRMRISQNICILLMSLATLEPRWVCSLELVFLFLSFFFPFSFLFFSKCLLTIYPW